MFCWGNNTDGRLGDATVAQRSVPTEESTHALWVDVTAGDVHSCGIRTDHTLYCWGSNANGRLGDGTTMGRLVPTQESTHDVWTQVSAGGGNTCAIQPRRFLDCWGRGGGVGDGTTTDRPNPRLIGRDNGDNIEPITDWVLVSVGSGVQALRAH